MASIFDPNCKDCPRLVEYLAAVKAENPTYLCAPVPPFGDVNGRLLIVGLAPGMHGANASGRPFTGDYAGLLLYQTLYEFGYGSAPESQNRDDGLRLTDCRITNAVKCLPPANKPQTKEIVTCNRYLAAELRLLPENHVVLALGSIAHQAVIRALGLRLARFPFAHDQLWLLEDRVRLLDCYHCSRYNTQTRRLTAAMFRAVLARAHRLIAAT